MNLPKIHSITKKIIVALLGGFLLIFLLFHMCANLCILRNDDGAWYSAFCHFMGTNLIIKIFEIVLLGCLALHICLTLYLWVCNKMSRPVGYHQPSRTKTAAGSKLMILTGILILACLVLHFTDFYFVKIGWVKGTYMVKTEKVQSDELTFFHTYGQQFNMTPEELVAQFEDQLPMLSSQMDEEEVEEYTKQLESLKKAVPAAEFVAKSYLEGKVSDDKKWFKPISREDKEMLEEAIEGIDVEPDFYFTAREKFKKPYICIMYLIFFGILFIHLRHAFASAFQTLGLYNYKYSKAIEVCALLYAILICAGFAAIPIYVILFI